MPSPDGSPPDYDVTGIVGSQTDIAPLGRSGPKPDHERTADEWWQRGRSWFIDILEE